MSFSFVIDVYSRRIVGWQWSSGTRLAGRSDCWTPLSGCDDWSHALRQAQWLADAARETESEIAAYWRGEAARLLAPLLHAAALTDGSVVDVLSWIDGQQVKRPVAALRTAGADAAIRQLSGVLEVDPRNRGTIYMSGAR